MGVEKKKFDSYFSDGLKPPTSYRQEGKNAVSYASETGSFHFSGPKGTSLVCY